MKWNVGTKIGAGFAIGPALLVVVVIVLYQAMGLLVETNYWEKHTFKVVAQIEELLSHLKDTETGQRGYLVTGEERYLEPYYIAIEEVDGHLRTIREVTEDNPRQQQKIAALKPLIAEKLAELQETITLRKNEGFDAAVQMVLTDKGKLVMDDIRLIITDMENEELRLLEIRSAAADEAMERATTIAILGVVVMVLIAGLVGFFLTINIARPLKEMTEAAGQIADGDLSVEVGDDSRKDEVGVLAGAFRQMTQYLREMSGTAERITGGDLTVAVKTRSEKDLLGNTMANMAENLRRINGEVREGMAVLASSAAEIMASTSQVVSGGTETAASVSQTTTTVEEVKQTIEVASQKAKDVAESAQNVSRTAQEGKKAVVDCIDGMGRIQGQMESIAESIVQLSEQSQAIGEIIASVNDLAEQSNLLAVNAAIEAAKAGEQGKGFAVVAQEVRSLAERSREATAQVRTILEDIQKATDVAVMATEQGNKAVGEGSRQINEAGESIRALAESVTQSAEAAIQIQASSQQQVVGIDQIVQAMENIKQSSEQNVDSMKQVEGTVQNFHELGQKLKQVTDQYQV